MKTPLLRSMLDVSTFIHHVSAAKRGSGVGRVEGRCKALLSRPAHGWQSVFVSRALGDAARWEVYDVPEPAAYTRHLRVLSRDPTKLLIMRAGHLPPSTTNKVILSVVDLTATLKL